MNVNKNIYSEVFFMKVSIKQEFRNTQLEKIYINLKKSKLSIKT